MRKQLFITSLFVLVLLAFASLVYAENKVIRGGQSEEVDKFYEMLDNGATGDFRFNLSNGEEYMATLVDNNGRIDYVFGPVNPKPKPVSSNLEATNDLNIPLANPVDIDSIPKEELKAAIAKANELWQAMENKEAEVFRTSYSEKDWKMVPVKAESGMVYVLLRQGIEGEITRGPRPVPEDVSVQTVLISQDTKKEPETPAQPEIKQIEPTETGLKQTGSAATPDPAVNEQPKLTTAETVLIVEKKPEEKKAGNPFVKLLKWLFGR